ncbi:amidase domain-containing protein [Gorillibacterium timonense]|uniref:amidase domain-containing protein n=1 Tax=Gorillibacterium timonense TaxID=1689269 RepID=UPI00071C71D7|nr:amidase domain-containing protein [Gorillibacterium timonense]
MGLLKRIGQKAAPDTQEGKAVCSPVMIRQGALVRHTRSLGKLEANMSQADFSYSGTDGGMAMDWKALIYEYAYGRNRMEADYDPAVLESLVDDTHYWDRQKGKIDRLNVQHRERGLEPINREVRMRLLALRPVRDGMLADVRLHSRFAYRIQGELHVEERMEQECLFLSARKRDWMIAGVEPDMREELSLLQGSREYPTRFLTPDARIESRPEPMLDPRADIRKTPFYDRERAAEYADRYWESANPAYLEFEVDCSNYVSQCIFAGGAPMNYTDRRDSGWWYRGMSGNRENWSYSWAVADSLRRYLSVGRSHGLRAKIVETPQELEPGDVISYCWKGDGRYGHSTVVAARDKNGMPLVNAHTVSSKHRYWDYRDSYAWTENTQYLFFHITDRF